MPTLPPGVTRDRYAATSTTLDTCHAVQVEFHDLPGRIGRALIVWRDSPPRLRPVRKGQSIRDLRPGDLVRCDGRVECVRGLVLYC
ncbi:hypothetical protein Pla175_12970 [Pirellulimonas nuda]|uniref:Uncharacterized protein n=1 Tax=Pirellulimonas nuda TaxID=2528009 RepID=A0A518D902_9BACT|nr:hypothetical protein [Pirellulimonas nuda]QDU87930.1 hypothetical protein Pla175_12970 [Pirellulimonas nuda]